MFKNRWWVLLSKSASPVFSIMQAKGTAKTSLASHFLNAIHTGTSTIPDQDCKANELAAALGNIYLGLLVFSIVGVVIVII